MESIDDVVQPDTGWTLTGIAVLILSIGSLALCMLLGGIGRMLGQYFAG